jgi:hypothetical protein
VVTDQLPGGFENPFPGFQAHAIAHRQHGSE